MTLGDKETRRFVDYITSRIPRETEAETLEALRDLTRFFQHNSPELCTGLVQSVPQKKNNIGGWHAN